MWLLFSVFICSCVGVRLGGSGLCYCVSSFGGIGIWWILLLCCRKKVLLMMVCVFFLVVSW